MFYFTFLFYKIKIFLISFFQKSSRQKSFCDEENTIGFKDSKMICEQKIEECCFIKDKRRRKRLEQKNKKNEKFKRKLDDIDRILSQIKQRHEKIKQKTENLFKIIS